MAPQNRRLARRRADEPSSARSALTLRLVLAVFGLIVCSTGALWLAAADVPAVLVAGLALLAVIAGVDLVVIVRRKRRGEPG